MNEDLLYKIALTQIPGIGSILAKNLVGYCGGIKSIFSKPVDFLKKVPGIGEITAYKIRRFIDFEPAEQEVKFIEKNKIQAHFFLDSTYPVRLRHIPDCPIMLYSKGVKNLSPEKCIAVVGTRKMTDYGRHFIAKFIESLATYKCTVISGLAYGTDIYTHKQCLKYGLPTFGILAHGLDRIYPSLHTKIANQMLEHQGAILSEYISGTTPDRENFPMRNRIVAGMVDAVVIVESAVRGGSLITAELANQYNRDVLAVPGNIGSNFSAGCNYLIKNHKAHLMDGVDDLVKLMNWDVQVKPRKQQELFVELTQNELVIMNILKQNEEIGIDLLQSQSNFKSSVLAITLLELELKSTITALPGKLYKSLL